MSENVGIYCHESSAKKKAAAAGFFGGLASLILSAIPIAGVAAAIGTAIASAYIYKKNHKSEKEVLDSYFLNSKKGALLELKYQKKSLFNKNAKIGIPDEIGFDNVPQNADIKSCLENYLINNPSSRVFIKRVDSNKYKIVSLKNSQFYDIDLLEDSEEKEFKIIYDIGESDSQASVPSNNYNNALSNFLNFNQNQANQANGQEAAEENNEENEEEDEAVEEENENQNNNEDDINDLHNQCNNLQEQNQEFQQLIDQLNGRIYNLTMELGHYKA